MRVAILNQASYQTIDVERFYHNGRIYMADSQMVGSLELFRKLINQHGRRLVIWKSEKINDSYSILYTVVDFEGYINPWDCCYP